MMRFESARARGFYDESQPLLDLIHPRSRPSLWALVTIYSSLLERIERSNYDVFRRRVRLSALEKIVDCGAGAGNLRLFGMGLQLGDAIGIAVDLKIEAPVLIDAGLPAVLASSYFLACRLG